MNNVKILLRSRILSGAVRAPSRRFLSVSAFQVSSLQKASRNLLEEASLACSRRCFSTSCEALKNILDRELNEEVEGGMNEMPDDLAELKQKVAKQWKIVDDGATTRMHRTVGGSKVVVSFHCQDTVEVQDDDDYPMETTDDEEPAMPFRFEVLVSKAGNTMVIGCTSSAGEATVDGVSMSNEDAENILQHGIGRTKYQGPEFPELEQDLQDAFNDYIAGDLGVNGDVSAFISMYADYREQMQYVQFLKDVTKVIS